MEVPKVKEYCSSDWSALTPASIEAPPWASVTRCVHATGYMGTRGGVLVCRFGDGAEATSLCVKPFKQTVNADHELLAAAILSRAAGLRVPAARRATQAEIDDAMTPSLIATFECTSGSWSMPDFLTNAGLYWLRDDLRRMAGIPSNNEHEEALKASRAARRAAVEAGEARAEPVAVLEFVRGPTLQSGGAPSEAQCEALGRIGATDVLINNFDRLPVFFDTEGNLGNVLLEPAADGSVGCCAIDSCVHPLEGAPLERYLTRLRERAAAPDMTAAAAALGALGGAPLPETHLEALRRGWARGLATICARARSGELKAVLEAGAAAAVAAGAGREQADKATAFVLLVAEAIGRLPGAAAEGPPPPPPTAAAEAHPEDRLSGASGLGTFLLETCAALPADARPLFAFDFDKTLTNGFAPPGAPLAERVRGGQRTLDGLRAAGALRHGRRCIVTARADETGRVGAGTLRQVAAQLARAQPELLDHFEAPADEAAHRIVELVPQGAPGPASACAWRDVPRELWGPGLYASLRGEGPVVEGGAVYAAGYDKALALLRACAAGAAPPPTHVFFVDDAPNNAYEVHRELRRRLRQQPARATAAAGGEAGGGRCAAEPEVRALWWDLYEEDFGAGAASPTTAGPDFAYLRGADGAFVYAAALRHFGLGEAAIAARAQAYERVERERDERRAARAAEGRARATPEAAPVASGPSVLDRRSQLQGLLAATGRAPAE